MRMPTARVIAALIVSAILFGAGCQNRGSSSVVRLAKPDAAFGQHELYLRQELVNDAPIGPGVPQPSQHCPTSPGTWFAGSGRSTAVSNVFGDLTEVEVYCVNVDRTELSGGIATWTDSARDTIAMSFGVKRLDGFAYAPAPNAPMVGFAQFTGGTGKWTGITGDALITGKQNGDGTATLDYRGTIYIPK